MNNDLISRSALKEAFEEAHTNFELTFDINTYGDVINIINNAPTVEAYTLLQVKELIELNQKLIDELEKRPQGEWIKGREISRTMVGDKVEHIEYKDYTCSNCGLVLDNLLYNYDGSPFYKFCPNCGADMRKGGAEE